MTDSTDNARGPERIFAEMEPYDFSGFSPCWVWHHPESIEDGTDGAIEYVRADLAPDPRVVALVQRIEQYDFSCEAGSLRQCTEWLLLKEATKCV